MKLLKRITSFLDVEREFANRFGVEISQSFVVAGEPYTITHGLNRTPKGWRVIDKDIAEANFGRTAWTNTTITIVSTIGGCTASFEVF